MKNLLYILIVLFTLSSCEEEYAFELIQKAENSYENDSLDHALLLLEKASHSNYGDCGLGILEAKSDIAQLKAIIHIEKSNYHLARHILDSSYVYSRYFDSLRILSYQNQIGFDSLHAMIDSSVLKTTFLLQEHSQFIYAIIPLSNGKDTMRIEARSGNNTIDQAEINSPKLLDWLKEFKTSWKYQMLTGNKSIPHSDSLTFDCYGNQYEMNMCSLQKFQYYDSLLQISYIKLITKYDSELKNQSNDIESFGYLYTTQLKSSFITSQNTWELLKEDNSKIHALNYKGGTMAGSMINRQKTLDTKERLFFINKLFSE